MTVLGANKSTNAGADGFATLRAGRTACSSTSRMSPPVREASRTSRCNANRSFVRIVSPACLLEGDKPVPLGSRALEILIALLERHGELVSKQDLMARVWPNVFVEAANLTVHYALRRLRDGQDVNRFIVNIPGRGYCFVASVAMSAHGN